MSKTVTTTKSAAVSFAVRYSTYHEVVQQGDWERTAFWGRLLLESVAELELTTEEFPELKRLPKIVESAELLATRPAVLN